MLLNGQKYGYATFNSFNASTQAFYGSDGNVGLSQKKKEIKDTEDKDTNTVQSQQIRSNGVSVKDYPTQNILEGVLQKISSIEREVSYSASFETDKDIQNNKLSLELGYATEEKLSFQAELVGQDGSRYQVSIEITITQSLYSKFGAKGIDLATLKDQLDGSEFSYGGNENDLPSSRQFYFLFDDRGFDKQLSSLSLPLNALFGELLTDGRESSLLNGLRVFENGGSEKGSNKKQEVQNKVNANRLLALGEQDYGIFVFNKISGLMSDLLNSQLVAHQKEAENSQQMSKVENFKQNTIKNAIKSYNTNMLIQFEKPKQNIFE